MCLAHHQDDSLETFLFRASRSSGLMGLRSLLPSTEQLIPTEALHLAKVYLDPPQRVLQKLRPLLAFSKQRLLATCQSFAQTWVEDPSNTNLNFDRIRTRQALNKLVPAFNNEADCLSSSVSLHQLVQHCNEYGAHLSNVVASVLRSACFVHRLGYCLVKPRQLASLPHEIKLASLARILAFISGSEFAPRTRSLTPLLDIIDRSAALSPIEMQTWGPSARRTLHGCVISPFADIGQSPSNTRAGADEPNRILIAAETKPLTTTYSIPLPFLYRPASADRISVLSFEQRFTIVFVFSPVSGPSPRAKSLPVIPLSRLSLHLFTDLLFPHIKKVDPDFQLFYSRIGLPALVDSASRPVRVLALPSFPSLGAQLPEFRVQLPDSPDQVYSVRYHAQFIPERSSGWRW